MPRGTGAGCGIAPRSIVPLGTARSSPGPRMHRWHRGLSLGDCQRSVKFTSAKRKKRLRRNSRGGRMSAGCGRSPQPERCSNCDGWHGSMCTASLIWEEAAHPGMPDTIPLQAGVHHGPVEQRQSRPGGVGAAAGSFMGPESISGNPIKVGGYKWAPRIGFDIQLSFPFQLS